MYKLVSLLILVHSLGILSASSLFRPPGDPPREPSRHLAALPYLIAEEVLEQVRQENGSGDGGGHGCGEAMGECEKTKEEANCNVRMVLATRRAKEGSKG